MLLVQREKKISNKLNYLAKKIEAKAEMNKTNLIKSDRREQEETMSFNKWFFWYLFIAFDYRVYFNCICTVKH